MAEDARVTDSLLRDELLREHRKLMTLVRELSELAGDRPADPEAWLETVRGLLGTLRPALSEHFQEEEHGPFARDFPSDFPHLAGRLDEILGQHGGLLSAVDAMMDGSLGAEASRGALRSFVEDLRRHEAAENDLLHAAYMQDTGGSG